MRILFLTPYLPLPTGSGGKIGAYGVASSLQRAGFGVEVFCYTDQAHDPLPEDYDLSLSHYLAPFSGDGTSDLRSCLERFEPDLVWVYMTQSWPLFEPHRDDLPHVLMSGDPMDQILALRWRWANKGGLNPLRRVVRWMRHRHEVAETGRRESEALSGARRLGVTSAYGPGDIEHIRRLAGGPVELCELAFPDFGRRETRLGRPVLMLLGNFNTVHTRYGLDAFFREVWPVWRRSSLVERALVRVIGAGKLPDRIRIPRNEPGLEFVGFVEDLQGEWEAARAALVPVPVDVGFRTRVVEAWSKGVPVLMDDASALGLPVAEDGRNCLVARTPDGWVAAADRLVEDDDLALTLGEGARRTFEDHYLCTGDVARRFGNLARLATERFGEVGR